MVVEASSSARFFMIGNPLFLGSGVVAVCLWRWLRIAAGLGHAAVDDQHGER